MVRYQCKRLKLRFLFRGDREYVCMITEPQYPVEFALDGGLGSNPQELSGWIDENFFDCGLVNSPSDLVESSKA